MLGLVHNPANFSDFNKEIQRNFVLFSYYSICSTVVCRKVISVKILWWILAAKLNFDQYAWYMYLAQLLLID